jgi:hypothetical protein
LTKAAKTGTKKEDQLKKLILFQFAAISTAGIQHCSKSANQRISNFK